MKNSGKITGLVLMLLIAGTFALSAQRGNNNFQRDARPQINSGVRQGRPIAACDSVFVRGLIPNLTEKQIADIKALGVKHQEEMTKFREENAKKVQTMKDENHKKFLGILTDEQKKSLEAATPPKPSTAKQAAPVAPAAKK